MLVIIHFICIVPFIHKKTSNIKLKSKYMFRKTGEETERQAGGGTDYWEMGRRANGWTGRQLNRDTDG